VPNQLCGGAARAVDQRSGAGRKRLKSGDGAVDPHAGEIRDGYGALLAAIGRRNRGRHRLPKRGRRNRCRQRYDQKEIPPLQSHPLLPFSSSSSRSYSIISSARSRIDGGTASSSALAVLRFTAISNFVGN